MVRGEVDTVVGLCDGLRQQDIEVDAILPREKKSWDREQQRFGEGVVAKRRWCGCPGCVESLDQSSDSSMDGSWREGPQSVHRNFQS